MKRYSGGQMTEGAATDPEEEWAGPGGETGLEEPMWHLGLNTGPESYLERPEEADCIHYLRTGFCGYGSGCRFNHPPDVGAAVGAMRASGGQYPERVGQPVCQYYMRTGICKYGVSCKYHHPRQGGRTPTPVMLNIYGYPLRPGEKECSYYVKTGQCKFGVTCKFHHPQPGGARVAEATPGPGPFSAPTAVPGPAFYPPVHSPSVQSSQQYGLVAGNWPVARPALLPGSYIPGPYGPMLLPPGVVTVPGWTPYPAPVSPVATSSTQPTVGAGLVYGLTQLSPSAPAYTGQYHSGTSSAGPSSIQKEHVFPERPGQPECQHYMKTGDCKFGSSCKYHHPPEWSGPRTNFVLSPIGLPLRPGATVCSHYAQNGVCKFGASCKFDHPMRPLSYSTSASSLTDIPVVPYPVGSSVGGLAPSSLSPDVRPELFSSGSAGSMFPKSGLAPHSSVQHSGLSSTPSSSTGKTVQGGEISTSS